MSGWEPDSPATTRGHTSRVRFSVDVYDGESLQSILARSVREHVLHHARPVLRSAGLKAVRPGRIHTLAPAQISDLAFVLRQDPSVLSMRSASLTQTGIRFGDLDLPKGLLDLHVRWVGPISLTERSFHRFSWSNRLLPFCPESGERLVGHCVACGEALGWHRSEGLGVCENCEETILPSEETPLPADLLRGYARIARLLSFDPNSRSTAIEEVSESLRTIDPATIALTALKLTYILKGINPDNELKKIPFLRAKVLARLVAQAGDALTDIEENAARMLNSAAARYSADQPAFDRMWVKLKKFRSDRRSSTDTRMMMTICLPSLTASKWSVRRIPEPTYQLQEALHVLGGSNAILRRLVDEKCIPAAELPSGKKRNIHLLAKAVDELKREMRRTIPLSTLGIRLGVPFYGAEQLAAIREVHPVNSKAFEIIYRTARVDRHSVEHFYDRIDHAASDESAPPNAIPLRKAMMFFGGKAKPWGSVLAALADRSLPFWNEGEVFNAGRVSLRQDDLLLWACSLPKRHHCGFPFSTQISQKDAAELLNITTRVFMQFGLSDLFDFRSTNGGKYASFELIEANAALTISRSELAQKWNLPTNKISGDPRLRGVERRLYGWDRKRLIEAQLID